MSKIFKTYPTVVGQALGRSVERRTAWYGLVGALLILALFATTLWRERNDALEHARQQADNLALIAERDISRNLELYGLSLQAMVENWAQPAIVDLPMAMRRLVLFDRSIEASNVTSAVILDSGGRVVLSMKDSRSVGLDLSDRVYFRSHMNTADDGMHISEPLASRVDAGTVNIALSRRLSNADGSFGGIAVVFLNVNYFRQLLHGIQLGAHGRTTIVGPYGRVVMSLPLVPDLIGKSGTAQPIYQTLVASRNGSFVTDSPVDGRRRLTAFRTVDDSGIKILVSPAIEDIFATWQRRAIEVMGAAALLAASLVVLAALLGRALRARHRAEQRMLEMAHTDGLTGLSNRRSLDAGLAREGARVGRKATELSLLFVDVDHFKRFNDSQGHPAGDAVLAAVGAALSGAIQRPGDQAGRYGGEEFLILLAQTDLAGACLVAEKVRMAVAALDIAHPDSPMGRVTVSIGVSSRTAEEAVDIGTLLASADAALYQAKSAGRNCVRVYGRRIGAF
ncbi:diguanylate cyclase [Xylophilus sp. Kf1]|nr:diguanylate cyclase [Xylophilus sp. Kf1]